MKEIPPQIRLVDELDRQIRRVRRNKIKMKQNFTISFAQFFNYHCTMADNTERRQLFARSTVSRGDKQRDILWNVTEPGDPYDIKKSMIAKLPGEDKKFMGEHAEIVCLLQAAEIERLHEYLQEYRQRYLQLEKRELDRHSYEIQIKQLTERLSNGDQLAIENSKLKAFISKLQNEIEDLRRNGSSDLAARYESLLLSMTQLREQNSRIRHQNQSLRFQVDSLASQLQAFEKTKSQNIRSLEMRLDEANYNASKVSSLSGIREKLQNEIRVLQRENQRLSDTVQMKNHEIQDLISKNGSLQKQISEVRIQSSTIAQYENKIALLSQEIERLNFNLKDKSSRYDQLSRDRANIENQLKVNASEKSRFDQEIRRRNSQMEGMRMVISQLQQEKKSMSIDRGIIDEYERKLKAAGAEIDRLDNRLRMEINEKNKISQDLQQLMFQMNKIPMLERENQQYRGKLGQITMLRKNIAEYQNKMALLSSELERLRGIADQLRLAKDENNRMRDENLHLREELDRMNRLWNEKHNTEITRVQSQFERKISSIAIEKDQFSQKKMSEAGNEISRLNDLLARERRQNESLKIQNQELVDLMNKRDTETRNLQMKIQSLRSQLEEYSKVSKGLEERDYKISALMTELETLKKRLYDAENRNNQIEKNLRMKENDERTMMNQFNEYKSRSMQSTEQLQRVSQNRDALLRQLEALRNENNNLVNQLRDIEINHQNLARDTDRYKQTISSFKEEKEFIQRDISELRSENERLRRNAGDLESMRAQIEYLKRQNQMLKAELDKAKRTNNEGILNITNSYETKITQYDQKIINMKTENDKAIKEIERLQGILRDRDANIDSLQYQLNSLRSNDELNRNQNIDLRRDIEKLKKELMTSRRDLEESENLHKRKDEKLMDLIEEIDRLNGLLDRKQKEGYDKDMRVQSISTEYEQIKSREGYIQKDLEFYRRENQSLKQKVDVLQKQLFEIENKFQLLNNELDRLQDLVGQKDNALKIKEVREKDKDGLLARIQSELRQTAEARRILESKVTQSSYTITRHQNSQKETEMLLNSLRKELDALRNQLIQTERQLQEEIRQLRADKARLEAELAKHNQEYHQKSVDYERVSSRISDLEQRYKNMEKKKKINEINERDSLSKIIFLESETLRLKKEKDRIQNRDVMELKIEIEKLLAENLNLKNYNEQLTKELDLRNAYHDKQNESLREGYQQKIRSLEIEMSGLRKSTLTKDVVKGLIKKTNEDVVKRNEFYEDQIKRAKDDGLDKHKKLQDQINKLMDDLQKGEGKKITLQEKVRYYEQTIDALDKKVDRFMEQLNNRDNQIREANLRYSEYKNKYDQIDIKLRQEIDLNNGNRRTIEMLSQQNDRLKKEIDGLRNLQWKIKEYQSKITILEQNSRQLEDYNTRIGKDFNEQNKRYTQLLVTVREYEEFLEALSNKYRQLESELNNARAENARLLERLRDAGEIERKASSYEFENKTLKDTIDKVNRERDADKKYNQDAHNNIKNVYETKITNLDQVILQLTQENESSKNKLRDLDDLRRRIDSLNEEIRILREENARFSSTINENRQQIGQLNEANANFRAKDEIAMRKVQELLAEIDRLNKLLDKSHAQSELCLDKSLHENMNLRKRLEDLQNMNAKISQYERRIQQLNIMNQKLTEDLNGKSRAHGQDLDRLRSIDQQNRNNKQLIDSLKESLNQAQKSMNMTKTSLSVEAEELKRKNNSIPELQARISALERELAQSQSELANIRQSGGAKEDELLRVRREYQQSMSRSTNERQGLLEDYRKLQNEYNTLLRQYQNAKKRAGQNDERMKQVYVEFDRLQEIINKLKSERMSIIEKNRVLGSQIDRLNSINQRLEESNEEYRLRIADMMTLEKRLQEQLALMVVLFAEIESLRNQLSQKEKESADARKDSMTPYRM